MVEACFREASTSASTVEEGVVSAAELGGRACETAEGGAAAGLGAR